MLILLVEDNEDDRFLAMRQLQRLSGDVVVEVARNGSEALQRLTGNPQAAMPSLVLLDLQLPKIDGVTILRKIRAEFSCQELPVIVLSSSDNPGDLTACRELGISGYLAKPLELADFQEVLAAIKPVADQR
jgi:CheY-like chemotaxis protein